MPFTSQKTLLVKMLAAPAVGALLFVVYLCYSLVVLDRNNDRLQAVQAVDFPALALATRNVAALDKIIDSLNDAAQANEPSSLSAANRLATDVRSDYRELIRIDTADRPTVERLQREFDAYFDAASSVTGALLGGNASAAADMIANMRDTLGSYRSDLAAYREATDARFRRTVSAATADSNRARHIGITIAATGLLASLAFGIAVAFAIKRQVDSVVRSFRDIAHDAADLNKRLPVTTADEMGDLVVWFNRFLDKLQGTISERANAEEQLRKLGNAVAQSRDCVLITDAAGAVEYVNDAYLQESGFERDEVLHQDHRRLFDAAVTEQQIADMRAGMQLDIGWTGELLMRRKHGPAYPVAIRYSPIRQSDGSITNYLAIHRDISEAKRTAQELDRHRNRLEDLVAERTAELAAARDAADAANRAKSAFLANMSHEIRTPLNGIIGLSELLMRGELEPHYQRWIENISTSGAHLLAIINDVLEISKIEAGKLVLEERDFAFASLLDEVHSMVLDRMKAKNLSWQTSIDPHVPARVRGDGMRVRQIILNFVSNAIKFTEQGGITVRISATPGRGKDVAMRCEVTDTGIGIAEADQARLFSPFEQVDASDSRRFGGTGLGLAISRRLAELMGGAVGVISSQGSGSTFWFTAQLKEAGPPVERNETLRLSPALVALRTLRELNIQGPTLRVMLAEDNALNQELVREFLKGSGTVLDIVANGAEAVQHFREHHHDLILMDMQMPTLDGLEATRQIRRLENGKDVPILALTANAYGDSRARCLEAGMNDHISKPVDSRTLYMALIAWHPAGRSAAPAAQEA